MTALVDALTPPPPVVVRCKVGRWVDAMSGDERAALEHAITVETPNTIYTRLAKAGHTPCSTSVWWRHWAEVCTCSR